VSERMFGGDEQSPALAESAVRFRSVSGACGMHGAVGAGRPRQCGWDILPPRSSRPSAVGGAARPCLQDVMSPDSQFGRCVAYSRDSHCRSADIHVVADFWCTALM